jgi:hypothetical protein
MSVASGSSLTVMSSTGRGAVRGSTWSKEAGGGGGRWCPEDSAATPPHADWPWFELRWQAARAAGPVAAGMREPPGDQDQPCAQDHPGEQHRLCHEDELTQDPADKGGS